MASSGSDSCSAILANAVSQSANRNIFSIQPGTGNPVLRTFNLHLLFLRDQFRIHLVQVSIIVITVIPKLLERREPGGIFRLLDCSPLEQLFYTWKVFGTPKVSGNRNVSSAQGVT